MFQTKTQSRSDLFLAALRMEPVPATKQSRDRIHLQTGDKTRILKSRLLKAGWKIAERNNFGGGEFQIILANWKLRGAVISIVTFRNAPARGKAYLIQN